MESGDLARTGVSGLEGRFTINIDHHQGNTYYGALNWVDLSAAACGEMVFDVIEALGVPLTIEIATHIYLAILTDTGSFHYSNITPKTFDICRRTTEAGVNPAAMARRVFDQNSFGKLKLIGALLARMDLLDGGRLAVMYLDDEILNSTSTTYNDTEGLINLPLTAREIQAVVFFKGGADGDIHISMRSKYDVDVRAVAARHGGGGHKNAAGFKLKGPLNTIRDGVIGELEDAIAVGVRTRP
jgi:phosphoesterase RecJ-like protein